MIANVTASPRSLTNLALASGLTSPSLLGALNKAVGMMDSGLSSLQTQVASLAHVLEQIQRQVAMPHALPTSVPSLLLPDATASANISSPSVSSSYVPMAHSTRADAAIPSSRPKRRRSEREMSSPHTLADWVGGFRSEEGPHSVILADADAEAHLDAKELLRLNETIRVENDTQQEVWDRRLAGHKATKVTPFRSRTVRRPDPQPPSFAKNPIDLKLCGEEEGRELHALFFAHAHIFVPIFEPAFDTFSRLRASAPFSLSAILFIGKKVQDTGKSISVLQNALKLHVESLCAYTLFCPIASLDALRSLVLIASWGDTAWRPLLHAYSVALHMGYDVALAKLGLGENFDSYTGIAIDHADLANRLRVFVMLSIKVHAIEFFYHRRLFIHTNLDDSIGHVLLKRPWTCLGDLRIVALHELGKLSSRVSLASASGVSEQLDDALRAMNDGIPAWKLKWQGEMVAKGVAQDDIMLTDVGTAAGAQLVLGNAVLLRSLPNTAQAEDLIPHHRQWLIKALQAGRQVIADFVGGEKGKLIYADHFSHICLANIAKIYIRLAGLFPDIAGLEQSATMLLRMCDALHGYPGVVFSAQLRAAINQAQVERLLESSSETRFQTHTTQGTVATTVGNSAPLSELSQMLSAGDPFSESKLTMDGTDPSAWDLDMFFGSGATSKARVSTPEG